MYRNKVRIVSGQWKRRLISFPDHQGLRPSPDRVRETLFNWLGQDLTGWRCLDLFAGSGALGFEAASRHASRVVMVELARPVVQALKENVSLLGATSIEVINADAQRYLASGHEQFDLVLLDPPFGSELLATVLPAVAGRVVPNGYIYVETADVLPLPIGWDIYRQGCAGKVNYLLLRPVSDEKSDT